MALTVIHQESNDIIYDKKTVDWLVEHTSVKVFTPLDFNIGYQRKIDEKHCDDLVKYLTTKTHAFFLPTAIICATDNDEQTKDYVEDPEQNLFIVDGQHRVEAFRRVKKYFSERYAEIQDYELPIIVLNKVERPLEIDTFITINKTSKRVDTSLALVLKNLVNTKKSGASEDISIPRRDYIAVEVARALNGDGDCAIESSIWNNRIKYDGPTKNTMQLLSLNAFVKATRTLLRSLEAEKLIKLEWQSEEEANALIRVLANTINKIWDNVRLKWAPVFDKDLEMRRIIQGSNGFTSINRFLVMMIKTTEYRFPDLDSFAFQASQWIWSIDKVCTAWLPGEEYSIYNSERGFSVVAQDLYKNCKYREDG